ncbi:MAG: 1,4-alpha-glucan branching protein GlgB [Oscillospiraceae bacterium]|nr:1,4-alpha-glucan branching protein GlgB [Oscillospiraceae bacterium]
MDYYGFYTGEEFEAYNYLGVHCQKDGAVFRTFAPSAERISVIGEFSGWNEIPMDKVYDGNFWECEITNAKHGQMYKFRVYKKDGTFTDHSDPYGFYSEVRPNTASIIYDLSRFAFKDKKWLSKRTADSKAPLNIYEMHFGSWKHNDDGEPYKYNELAEAVIPYLKENGYNYIELMPLNEYPCDESWGYQATGFFSATSRYGEPDELRYFVDKCHQSGIGVILDFVPVHFAVDDYALWNYDGTPLYEYPHGDVGHSEWGSCNFMHSRGEVRSFLQSAAYFWLKEFHFDGLRMDAVSNLIYWQGDSKRGENKMAIDFIRSMNRGIKQCMPDVILIAEDSSCYKGVTAPIEEGGLGFDFKWDLGWMNDTLDYFRMPVDERIRNYHRLTFSMMYFYDEKFILPLSHDENVHGKATVLQKMNGDYNVKFPQARAMYLYMLCHPGKKLNFMGGEFGQLREWNEKREQDWEILKYPNHDAFRHYISELNQIYLKNNALYENDFSADGFKWLDCHSEELCAYAFVRKSSTQTLLAVFNFSDKQLDYSVETGSIKKLELLIDSDFNRFGGSVSEPFAPVISDKRTTFRLAPFSGQLYIAK